MMLLKMAASWYSTASHTQFVILLWGSETASGHLTFLIQPASLKGTETQNTSIKRLSKHLTNGDNLDPTGTQQTHGTLAQCTQNWLGILPVSLTQTKTGADVTILYSQMNLGLKTSAKHCTDNERSSLVNMLWLAAATSNSLQPGETGHLSVA